MAPGGYTEEGKVFARLTYNPYFEIMFNEVLAFLNEQAANE